MKTPFRHIYNPAFFEQLCPVLRDSIVDFDDRDFIFRIFNNAWPDMEFKERVGHIAKVLHHFLPEDFPRAAKLIIAISQALKNRKFPHHGFENIFLAEYIDLFGDGFPDLTAKLKKEVSKTIGAEYAGEPLLIGEKI